MIRINGGTPWDARFAVFILAGEEVTIDSEAGALAQQWTGDGEFLTAAPRTTLSSGPVRSAGTTLTWRAPKKPGTASLVLKTADPERGWVETARLNVQVMAPMNQLANGVLDGYRIGKYPKPSSDKTYVPPTGFLKVAKEAERTPVSPRFYLEDFACKQTHAGDRYVALQPRLLPFLEAIAARVEQEGFVSKGGSQVQKASHDHAEHGEAAGRNITIMSGYRTPAYNASLGNVELSRHQYGDASDIIIDSDGDGSMDDLNKDGRLNGKDALTLAAWIEDIWGRPEFADRPGGLGVYNGTDSHGPFVHVDLRGKRARWGGNGLEWSDAAVGHADNSDGDPVIQTASYKKSPAKTLKARKSSRSKAGSAVRNASSKTARR